MSAHWARAAERGNRLALKLMAFIAVVCGRRIARLVLHPITLYFVLFARSSARHSARYLQRALGRPARWSDRYRHVFSFAATVLDRVYLARGRLDAFALRLEGAALMDTLVAQGRGALLLGAHLGSFEALHAVGAGRPGLRVAMAMYPDNARMIHETLRAIAPDFHLDIITIGRSSSTLAMRDWLDAGGLVGMLGDRVLSRNEGPLPSSLTPTGPSPNGNSPVDCSRLARSWPLVANAPGEGGPGLGPALGALRPDAPRSALVELPFLGRPARFSDGPFRLALLLRRPLVFMVGLYRGGNRYDVRFEPLADFSQPTADAAARDNLLRAAMQAYVQRLEALCREAPFNWFNFFDFWNEDA